MQRKLKVLGVALVALFALSAVAASSALAAEGSITPGATPATITGSQLSKNKFAVGSAGARTVECSTVHFDSTTTTSAASSNVIVHPEYSGCITLPGSGPATVSTTGCDLNVTATTKINATSGEGSGKLEGTSCDLTIEAFSTGPPSSLICKYTVPNQTATGSVKWTSSASDVTLNLNTTQTSVTVLSGTLAACGASAGNPTIGKLTGEVTVTAEVGSTATSLSIS